MMPVCLLMYCTTIPLHHHQSSNICHRPMASSSRGFNPYPATHALRPIATEPQRRDGQAIISKDLTSLIPPLRGTGCQRTLKTEYTTPKRARSHKTREDEASTLLRSPQSFKHPAPASAMASPPESFSGTSSSLSLLSSKSSLPALGHSPDPLSCAQDEASPSYTAARHCSSSPLSAFSLTSSMGMNNPLMSYPSTTYASHSPPQGLRWSQKPARLPGMSEVLHQPKTQNTAHSPVHLEPVRSTYLSDRSTVAQVLDSG